MQGEGSGNNYAYLVTDDKTKDAVIIDPANPSEYISCIYNHEDVGRLTQTQGTSDLEEGDR